MASSGLLRCGKSCRLRWTNYLRPDIKRGNFSVEEEESIIKLHQILGNRNVLIGLLHFFKAQLLIFFFSDTHTCTKRQTDIHHGHTKNTRQHHSKLSSSFFHAFM